MKMMMKSNSQLFLAYNKKFLSYLIRRGLKLKALRKYNDILYQLKLREKVDPRLVLFASLMQIAPAVIIKNRLKGRTKIPYVELTNERVKLTKAVAWVVKDLADKQKNRNPSTKKIVEVLCDSLRNKGDAIKKKHLIYSTAHTLIT